jgi:hypothetical protein
VNVTVDNATNEIKAIGTNLPPAQIAGTTQVDLLHVHTSYQPNIGDVLDKSKIVDLYDIKTSLTGAIDADQLRRLKAVAGKDIVVVKSAWRWTTLKGWTKNKTFGAGFKILGLIGAAFTAYAWVNYSDYDVELVNLRNVILGAKEESDPDQKKIRAIDASDRIRVYLAHFMAGSTAPDIIHLVRVYQIMGDDSFEEEN